MERTALRPYIMNITSYLTNKCFELLLFAGVEKKGEPNKNYQGIKAPSLTFFPPWVKDPDLFQEKCDGCGKCISSCESEILILDQKGYPKINFAFGSCTFCGKCVASCPYDLFTPIDSNQPWNLKAIVTNNCLTHNNVLCRTCTEYCDEGAFVISTTNGALGAPNVNQEKCNGCGACYSPCPVRAIQITNQVEKINNNEKEGR